MTTRCWIRRLFATHTPPPFARRRPDSARALQGGQLSPAQVAQRVLAPTSSFLAGQAF
jgi:hypothetical protein